jgi:hypothetical protein
MALDNFNLEIEKRAAAHPTNSYIEAIKDFVEEKEMDEYDVVELLHPIIIEKVKNEFRQRSYFPGEKTATLDAFFDDEPEEG